MKSGHRGKEPIHQRDTKEMIHGMYFLIFLEVEACNMNLYILSKFPHSILKDITLDKEFTSVKSYVSYFHVLHFLDHIHMLEEERNKCEPSSIKGIFSQIIVVNRDVKYDEYSFPYCYHSNQHGTSKGFLRWQLLG